MHVNAIAYPVDGSPLRELPQIGGLWNVPCIGKMPVFGTLHSDSPGQLHYHVDYRFVSDEVFADLEYTLCRKNALTAISAQKAKSKQHRMRQLIYRRHWPDKAVTPENPDYSMPRSAKLDLDCMLCPHKQTYLGDIQQQEIKGKRVVVCPAHRMAWNLKNGRIVKV